MLCTPRTKDLVICLQRTRQEDLRERDYIRKSLGGERREGVVNIAVNTRTLPMIVKSIGRPLSRQVVTIKLAIVLTNFCLEL